METKLASFINEVKEITKKYNDINLKAQLNCGVAGILLGSNSEEYTYIDTMIEDNPSLKSILELYKETILPTSISNYASTPEYTLKRETKNYSNEIICSIMPIIAKMRKLKGFHCAFMNSPSEIIVDFKDYFPEELFEIYHEYREEKDCNHLTICIDLDTETTTFYDSRKISNSTIFDVRDLSKYKLSKFSKSHNSELFISDITVAETVYKLYPDNSIIAVGEHVPYVILFDTENYTYTIKLINNEME